MVKDLISLLSYAVVSPFRPNRKAVLVYHAVERLYDGQDPLKMSVDPDLFEAHMKYLSKFEGRFTVTFDDGFASVYDNAFPLLKKYRMRAILFLTTDFIDGKKGLAGFFGNRYDPVPLSWAQVRRMHLEGVEIGSHSVTHENMAALDREECRRQAALSRIRIESEVASAVTAFSYPIGNSGSFNGSTRDILKEAGYSRCYTNIMGPDNSKEDPFFINRIRIYPGDNMARFRMKVAGAYNWVDSVLGLRKIPPHSLINF